MVELKTMSITIKFEGTSVLSKHGGQAALYPAKGHVRNGGGMLLRVNMDEGSSEKILQLLGGGSVSEVSVWQV